MIISIAALAIAASALTSCADTHASSSKIGHEASCSLSYLKDVTAQKNYDLEKLASRDLTSKKADE